MSRSMSTLRSAALVGALAIVAAVATPANAGEGPVGVTLKLALAGSHVPEGGDPNGAGRATIKLVPSTSEVCWDVSWSGLAGKVTGLHIHHAGVGKTGPHAVDLVNDASLPGSPGGSDGCTTAMKMSGDHGSEGSGHNSEGSGHAAPKDGGGNDHAVLPSTMTPSTYVAHDGSSVVDEIIANPGDYYLNVHSTDYDKGALRGQLG